MSNILDYMEWRGDLDFNAAKFNEIDNLIFSQLIYLDFDAIVENHNKKTPTLKEVSQAFFSLHNEKNINLGVLLPKEIIQLLKITGNSPRFENIRLSCYVNHIDPQEQVQFSAVTIELPDGIYIAFRGTDDTIVGWKEDFNMCFTTPVPAQKESVEYITNVLQQYGKRAGNIRIGGHSKGGNLAVYAASFCPEEFRNQITAVYNNDGPGFDTAMMKNHKYQEMLDRITTFLPQSSTVGMLLEHEEPHVVIQSDASGLFQHDAFSWQVLGSHFVTSSLTNTSRFLDRTLKTWLSGMDQQQRTRFVDTLFEILIAGEAHSLTDLENQKFKLIQAAINMSNEDKKLLFATIKQLLNAGTENLKQSVQKKQKISKDKT